MTPFLLFSILGLFDVGISWLRFVQADHSPGLSLLFAWELPYIWISLSVSSLFVFYLQAFFVRFVSSGLYIEG